jgi:hypothetical protein
MERRQFIGMSSVALLNLLDCHQLLSAPQVLDGARTSNVRITSLQLLTVTPIAVLKKFYGEQLGLPVAKESPDSLAVQAGSTRIVFTKAGDASEAPFYHVAFNIPENKIIPALAWQKDRSVVLPTPAHMIDRRYPEEIRHFRNWNAHSVFFWDPAGNLLEYIARHDLANPSPGDFTSKDILCASEIAFIVNDVDDTAAQFGIHLKLKEYRQGNHQFRAMGDENGLLLIMQKGRIWMDNTSTPKQPGIYKTIVSIKSDVIKPFSLTGYPYDVIMA